jgi:large subunit ribosomal protein L24
MSLKFKKGDKVSILTGKDKGKTGRILKFLPENKTVIVEGINLVKKHLKRRSESEPGGIKEIPSPVHISNVILFCSNCNRGTRYSIKNLEDKSKIRLCKRCNRTI